MLLTGQILESWAEEIIKKTSSLSAEKINSEENKLLLQIQRELTLRKKDLTDLQQFKILLINGNITAAKKLLLALEPTSNRINSTLMRYQALIYFLEDNYQKSLEVISTEIFSFQNHPTNYQKICHLKILNLLMLGYDTTTLADNFSKCINLNRAYSSNEFIWLMALIQSKDHQSLLWKKGLLPLFPSIDSLSNEGMQILLKLILYLNQKKTFHYLSANIHPEYFKDRKIRELLGFINYRYGNQKMATDFIENIVTANTENIRGNIELAENKYELAYGHFKVALNKKSNSLNAVERIVPLTWILNKWDEGVELVERLPKEANNREQRLALVSALELRKGDYPNAFKNLQILDRWFKSNPPPLVTTMLNYVALIVGDFGIFKKSSARGCSNYNPLNCLYLWYMHLWPSFDQIINNQNPVATYEDNEITLESLKTPAPLSPLKEDIFINQKEIEELDK